MLTFCNRPSYSLKVLSVISLAVSIAACDAIQYKRFTASGPGTDLYTSDIRESTDNLNTYLGYLCDQADVPVHGDIEHPRCPLSGMDARDWTLVVATGMNDIDRRCDQYLAWLDNERRTRNYVNAQFAHVRTLTSAVLGLATSDIDTITTVASALGFAQDSYNSYQNRLLFDIEGSTVQSIVIKRRLNYRNQFAAIDFRFKPDAVRVLRDYLRICTPYAIAMSINTYSRAQVVGGSTIEEQETDNLGDTLVTSKVLRAETPVSFRIKRPPVVPAVGWDKVNVSYRPIDPRTAKTIQKALCMSNVDGIFGWKTEAHLRIFESVLEHMFDGELDWESRTVQINQPRLNQLRADSATPCPAEAANYLERRLFRVSGGYDKVKDLLKAEFPNDFGNGGTASVRRLIKRLRSEKGLNLDPKNYLFADQITPDLLSKVPDLATLS